MNILKRISDFINYNLAKYIINKRLTNKVYKLKFYTLNYRTDFLTLIWDNLQTLSNDDIDLVYFDVNFNDALLRYENDINAFNFIRQNRYDNKHKIYVNFVLVN